MTARVAQSGVSLMEVLVAFAIMTSVLAVLLPGQIDRIAGQTDRRQQALAHELAISIIEEIAVVGPQALQVPPGSTHGFTWSIESRSSIEPPGNLPKTMVIHIHDTTGRLVTSLATVR